MGMGLVNWVLERAFVVVEPGPTSVTAGIPREGAHAVS